jgi:hypothetical protein
MNPDDWSINRRNSVGGIAGHSNNSSDAGNTAGPIRRNNNASVQDVYDMVYNLCVKVKVLEVRKFILLLFRYIFKCKTNYR